MRILLFSEVTLFKYNVSIILSPIEGVTKCRKRTNTSVCWPSISRDIHNKVSNCDFCQKNLPSQGKGPLITTPLPERAWKKIGADQCEHQGKQFLVVIDYSLRFPEIAFMSSTTGDAVIKRLKDVFARWGIPDEIVSDNGLQFVSDQFHKFSQEYDSKHTTTSSYFPQANGEAESGVRFAKKILTQHDPFPALMSYQATPHTSTGVSPCQLMMGREIRTLLPTLESNLKPVLPNHEAAAKKDEHSKTAYREYFDTTHGVRPLSDLQPVDSVHVKLDQQKGWKTPGKVIARSPTPWSYAIQTPFTVVRRNCRHLRTAGSPNGLEMSDEHDLDSELTSLAKKVSSGSSHTESGKPQQIVEPCRVMPCVQPSCKHTG